MTILRCFSRIVFAFFPPSIAARIAADSVVADASSAAGSTGGFPKYCGFPPTPLATKCAVFARVLGSSLPKPVTALSDAGFLVVVAAGAVVAVDAGAAGVDGVAAVVEAAAAVVLGAGEDMETILFICGCALRLMFRAIALTL